MFGLINRLLKGSSGGKQRRKVGAVRPVLEELEMRNLLAGAWTALANPIPGGDGGQTAMLLSDGTVLVHGGAGFASNAWYKLTPNANGSYFNGTWTTLAPMSTDRLYFGSAVLPNGNVFVVGGEYSGPLTLQNEINTAELYNPVTNTWTTEPAFPQAEYGDDPVEVLPNGTVLAGYLNGPQTYIFNPTTSTWTATGTKLYNDPTSEEAWVKLPDNSILDYDITSSLLTAPGAGQAQRYIPSTGQWVATGPVPTVLSDDTSDEMGPGLLLPDGRVFITGTTGTSAYYYPPTYSNAALRNTWAVGPTLPTDPINGPLGAADAPSAVLPNGDILMALGPVNPGGTAGNFNPPTEIYEFNPSTNTFTNVTPPDPNLPGSAPYITSMLDLPTGQVLMVDDSGTAWLYTAIGAPQAAWLPTVSNIVNNGNGSFTLTGTQLNGFSEGSDYNDENISASNYPILQLIDQPVGPASTAYARTFNWSSTGVQTGTTPETVQFTMPAVDPPGAYLASVTPNGLASTPLLFVDMGVGANNITLQLDPVTPNTLDVLEGAVVISKYGVNQFSSILVVGNPGGDNLTINNAIGGVIAAPITFNAAAGTNNVTIIGNGPLGSFTFNGAAGTNTLTVKNAATATDVWNLIGSNSGNVNGTILYSNVQNLVGGAGIDEFNIFSSGSLTGTLTGGAGSEWLDYATFPSNVTVNLTTGTATRLGRVVNVQNVIGSARGDDTLTGGASGGVLVAHGVVPTAAGLLVKNTLTAGAGASILIGGFGQNTLRGSTSSDLLIDGATSYDSNIPTLVLLLNEWQSANTFATRVSQLQSGGGLNGTNKLVVGTLGVNGATVQLNPVAVAAQGLRYSNGVIGNPSTLTGGASNNWFLTASKGNITNFNALDVVTL